jgi:hypothetical protein
VIEEDGVGQPSNQKRRSSGPIDGVHFIGIGNPLASRLEELHSFNYTKLLQPFNFYLATTFPA